VTPRRLIVNADDLGLHVNINVGVMEAYRRGIVTSASLCPNGAAFDDAVKRLREVPDLDIGVHLTVVGSEAPLLRDLPTLAPSGRLPHKFGRLFRDLALARVRREEIEAEMAAQVERARDAGVRISHLDSHQHVHLHPVVLAIVIAIAQRFGIGAVRAARRVVPVRGMKAALLGMLSWPGSARVRAAGLKTPDNFVGADDSGRLDVRRLERLIEALPPGTSELLCHPGTGTDEIAGAYPDWGFRWDEETQALTAPHIRDCLRRAGVTLMSYRDL
jgi:hopanoid biosynthesis associated protein HpnK